MVAPRGVQAIAIIGAFEALAFVAFLLRMYTRFVLMRNSGKEDYCLIFAAVCSIALTILIGEQVKYGMGQHISTLSPETIVKSLQSFWASIWVYYLALSFIKISLFFQYLRVFTMRGFRIACWTVLALVILFNFWTFFGSIFLCQPVQYFWDKSIKGGKCFNEFAVWFTNASFNICTDFASILLPMSVLKNLQLPRRQKWALMVIFALGGFGCLVSILRLRSLVTISNSTDPTYDNPPAATWSSIETSVGIICASLPALKLLLAKLFPGAILVAQFPSIEPQPARDSFVSKDCDPSNFSHKPGSSAGSISSIGSKSGEIDPEKGVTMYGMEQHVAQISTRAARSTNPPVFENYGEKKEIKVVTVLEQAVLDKRLPPLPEEIH